MKPTFGNLARILREAADALDAAQAAFDAMPSSSGETKISADEISCRLRKLLNEMGITTIEQLSAKSQDDLLTHRNFGLTAFNEAERLLRKYGQRLVDAPGIQ